MELREIAMTNFVLLRDTWTNSNCLELLRHLQPAYAIISKEGMPDQYYLIEASDLSQYLTNASNTASLAEVIATTTYTPVPALESDSEAENAPDQCIVLEDEYPIGFFDASVPPDSGTLRTGREANGEIDFSEFTLPFLVIDAPTSILLDDIVSIRAMLSTGQIPEGSAALSLSLPSGTVIDIIMQVGRGLVFEGDSEGQLVITQEETSQLQFRLRGVEPGPRQFRIFAFHNRRPLGFLALRVLVVSLPEISQASHHSEVHPLEPLSTHFPGLSQLTFERDLTGKAELTPPLNAPDQQGAGSVPPAEGTAATYPQILWQGCQPESLVRDLQVDRGDSKTSMPSKDLLASELHDLLGRLFSDAGSILVETLIPGFSGAKVLKVQPFVTGLGGGRPFVVKFGDVPAIEREYTNYKKYIHYFIADGRNTSVSKYEKTTHLGGILYSFAGTDIRRTQDFGVVYQQRELSQVKAVLDNLFHSTCRAWYASAKELSPLNLTEAYQEQSSAQLAELERTAAERLPAVRFQQILTFTSFKTTPARSFFNPFRVLSTAGAFIRPTYITTTHGDLNQHNILVDQTGYSWLIDFQYTGPSHILRDVATLDAVTRFQLLSAHQATLDEFLVMEEALFTARYFSQLEDLRDNYQTDNPALTKTYLTALHLRTLAHWIVEKNPADDLSEYYIALLYLALDTLQYFSLREEQRERALLSASLLVDLLGLTRE